MLLTRCKPPMVILECVCSLNQQASIELGIEGHDGATGKERFDFAGNLEPGRSMLELFSSDSVHICSPWFYWNSGPKPGVEQKVPIDVGDRQFDDLGLGTKTGGLGIKHERCCGQPLNCDMRGLGHRALHPALQCKYGRRPNLLGGGGSSLAVPP